MKFLESTFIWRVMAVVELICLLVFGVTLFRLAITNLFILTGLVVSLALCAYGSWLIFTGIGRRLHRGYMLSGLGLLSFVVLLFAYLNKPNNVRYLAAAGIAGAIYVVIFSFMRVQYWRRQRNRYEPQRQYAKKPCLIINPKSGDGRAVKAGLADVARRRDIKVIVMKKGDDMQKLARQAINKGADVLGISGGDGSIGAVAKVAIEHDVPLVVLPGGTRCHFARDLGLDPRALVDALDGFNGIERRIDVGDINGRIFLNNASLGAYADIVNHAEYRDHKVAVTRKVLQEILSGKKSAYPIRFRAGEVQVEQAVQILIGVNRYTSMKLLELGHRDEMDGGVLQINVVRKLTDRLLRQLLRRVSIDRISSSMSADDFLQFDVQKLRIKGQGTTMAVGVDGESETYKLPIVISNKPKVLRLRVPAEGLRPRPKSMFSMDVIKRIVHIAKYGVDTARE